MRLEKRHAVAAAVLALAVAGLLAAGAGAAPAAFTDPAGDSGAAPDITKVAVDDTAGSVTVAVTAGTLVPGTSVDVLLNTDKNDSTGSPSGFEYWLEVWQDASDWGWDISKWSNSDWTEVPQSATEHFSRSGNVYTWTMAPADIGSPAGFTFWTGGFMTDSAGNVTAHDQAPDGGDWVYDLPASSAIVPAIGKPLAVPAVPRAGKLLSLSFPVTRADTGASLTGGTVAVQTSIAGQAVPRTTSLAGGAAHVNVLVPKAAKGKVLRVKVTVTLGTKTTTRVAAFVVA